MNYALLGPGTRGSRPGWKTTQKSHQQAINKRSTELMEIITGVPASASRMLVQSLQRRSALASVLLAAQAYAVGLRLPNQDPEGIARGNAFVATADNPSAIYYNPAGISQLEGDQFRVGLYLISADTKYTSPSGAKAHTDTGFQAVPQMHYTHAFKDTAFTMGLGVYAPYGLGIDWGSHPPFEAIARKGKLMYATVNPVIAWRACPTLSLAVGPTLNYGDAKLQNASFKFHGNDVALGFNAGLLWQPRQQWSLGLKYHSATELELGGHSEFPAFPALPRSATTTVAHFPQFVTGGISYRPTTNWNFEFDVDWTDWDNLNQLIFLGTALGPIPFLFNYHSSWMYESGVTRQLGNGWFISAGYIFSENSSPDANFNPIVPDSDLHLGSIGFGHHGKRWDWALGYHFAYNGSRTVTGAAIPLANGVYRTFNNAVNLSVTYKF